MFGAFDPGRVLAMMEQHQVPHMFASPSILQALTRHPSVADRNLTPLRAILVGGAPITDATALAAHRVFGDTLYQAYGQTEAVPLTAMGPEEWFGKIEGSAPLGAAGRVIPFAEVEIRDSNGAKGAVGVEGEIVARCEGQMRGYWGDEALTKTRLVDGWVHTGDIGKLDANGFLYVLDRSDDMIVSGGYNIWPAELETVIPMSSRSPCSPSPTPAGAKRRWRWYAPPSRPLSANRRLSNCAPPASGPTRSRHGSSSPLNRYPRASSANCNAKRSENRTGKDTTDASAGHDCPSHPGPSRHLME
jgi:acyl-CoA synthetase (AMP-forming)/AMP-acid ligase II